MKTKHITAIKILPLVLLVAVGAVSCATGPEGDAAGNGSALTGRGPGRGQGGRGHGAFAEERIAELTQELGLSEEQAAKVRAIHEEAMAEAQATGDRSGRFEMRARIHERIAEILTPEQRERFAQRPVERRLEHLTERLGLDARQVEQVRAILQESRTQMEQQLAATAAGPARREAMMTVHEQARQRIAAVLTAEQRETFEDMPGAPGFGPHGRGGPGGHHRQGFGGDGPGACGGGEGCPGACGGNCGGDCGGDCGGGEGCPGACGGN